VYPVCVNQTSTESESTAADTAVEQSKSIESGADSSTPAAEFTSRLVRMSVAATTLY